MGFTKFASFEVSEVLDVKGAATQQRLASLDKLSEYDNYRTNDGYMYARITAISSRVNKNNDGWPSVELAGGEDIWDRVAGTLNKTGAVTLAADSKNEYGYSTFVGKPIFIDHNNTDTDRARGVIVDAKFHVEDGKTASQHDSYYSSSDVDPEHLPPAKVELLLEIDAQSFPKLAEAVVQGSENSDEGIDGFSMGCDVERSKCSHCGNVATSPREYCNHIRMKGAHHDYTSSEGKKVSRKSYENCYGIKFFEISAVFDPADETALLQELIKEGAMKREGFGTDPRDPIQQHLSPDLDEVMALANKLELESGMAPDLAIRRAEQILMHRNREDFGRPGAGDIAPDLKVQDTMSLPGNFPDLGSPMRMKPQGSYLAAKKAATKTADNPLPQFMHTKAPDSVDTLREEKVCPVCGEDMEGEKCAVCGHVEPPDGFNNPDLSQARGDEQGTTPEQTLLEGQQGGPPAPGTDTAVSYLDAKKQGTPPQVSDSSGITSAKINPVERPIKTTTKPATDEPTEKVISDQDRPVTSAYRTAMDLIQAANRQRERNNMGQNRVAAEPADSMGTADKRVDVEGVGGVADASNEQASKADKQTDVEGKGGIHQDSNEEASKENTKSENLPTAGKDSDDAGYNKNKTTDDSGPTRTWDNSNEPDSAVTSEPFPSTARPSHTQKQAWGDERPFPHAEDAPGNGSASHGTEPADPVGKADDRVTVTDTVSVGNPQKGTDQWTGTGGNGVTRQQDPVTRVVDPNIEGKPSGGNRSSAFAHVVAAMKLADTEIEMGLLDKDQKYERVAELEALSPETLEAEARVVSRVKTAGLEKRVATRRQAASQPHQQQGRLPSFQQKAGSVEKEATPVNETVADSALFLR